MVEKTSNCHALFFSSRQNIFPVTYDVKSISKKKNTIKSKYSKITTSKVKNQFFLNLNNQI